MGLFKLEDLAFKYPPGPLSGWFHAALRVAEKYGEDAANSRTMCLAFGHAMEYCPRRRRNGTVDNPRRKHLRTAWRLLAEIVGVWERIEDGEIPAGVIDLPAVSAGVTCMVTLDRALRYPDGRWFREGEARADVGDYPDGGPWFVLIRGDDAFRLPVRCVPKVIPFIAGVRYVTDAVA